MELWWVRERSNGWTLLGDFTSYEAAVKFKAEKIAEDPAYADVLIVTRAGSDLLSDPDHESDSAD
jgi:hypothetical protein